MTGPPATKPSTRSAPTVNRAQHPQMVLVRTHTYRLAGRVSVEFANRLLTSGAAQRVGKNRLRYLRLEPGFVITSSTHGWALIDEQRRKHGDDLVRSAIIRIDRRAEFCTSRTSRTNR